MPVSKITTIPDRPSRMQRFDPDARWYHPVVAMVCLYALVGVPQWTHLPPILLAPLGLAGTVAAVGAVRHRWHAAEHGDDLPATLGTVVTIGGTLGTVWLVWAASQPHQRPWLTSTMAVGALALLTVGVAVFYAALVSRAPRLARVTHDRVAAGHDVYRAVQQQAADEKAAGEWETILHAVPGCEGLKVLERQVTAGGTTLHLLDDPEKPLKFSGLQDRCGVIESIAAHRLAKQGIKLLTGKVTAEPGDAAHLLLLHINTNNRFRQSIPFDMNQPVDSILNKQNVAVYEDGKDVELDLYGIHGCMIGATGSGKDVFTNNLIGRVTRCDNTQVWIGGSDKLSSLAWAWIAPWLRGDTQRPLIDWVAGESPQQVLMMLADLYKIIKLRNQRLGADTAHDPSPEDPAIFAVLTEASDLLIEHSTVTIMCHDGVRRNGSRLVYAIVRSGRSAGVSLFLSTQSGLMDALGTHGTYAKRNITLRVAGKVYSYSDASSTLVGVSRADATKLTDYTLYIQPSHDVPRVMPAKAYLLDGEASISAVARRNTGNLSPGLPSWITDQLEHYAGRWSPQRLPEIYDNTLRRGWNWPSPNLPGSVTVGDIEGETSSPQDEETRAMTATRLLQEGREKMAVAREKIALYGPLGETMSLVLDAARAGDSPEFLPVSPLAVVAGLAPDGGDTSPAVERLESELAGKPWGLAPVTHGGQRGWWKQDVIDRCREFLTGEKIPRREIGGETVALLAALSRSSLPFGGEAVKSADVLAVAAGELGWPDNPEGGRKVADALRAVGVESFRPTGGERATSYLCGPLKAAMDRHVKVAVS